MINKIKDVLMSRLTRELIIYIIAGVATTAVDWIVTFILSNWCTPTLSNAVAIVVSIIFAYLVNSRYVFETKPESMRVELRMFTEFVGARVVSSVIQLAAIFIFVDKLGFNHYVIKALASVFVIVFNYVVSKLWIFKKKED